MAEPNTSLRFLSWNLAMMERPAGAPVDWGQEHTQWAVRELVLDLEPDVVAFQELPGVVPYVETHDMIRANPMSHSGNLATLATHTLLDGRTTSATVPGCAVLLTLEGPALTVANVHLPPGRAAAPERTHRLAAVAEAAPTEALVVLGDFNLRAAEEPDVVDLGLSLPRPPRPTWDSRRNRFRTRGPEFVASFTRCATRGPVRVVDQDVLDHRPVEVDDHRFHLSDHYALTGCIEMVDVA